MTTIDCNVDIGEGFPHDFLLLPLVSSANIACGAHAGHVDLMRQLVQACRAQGVAIGAHPGYADPAYFGRREFPFDRTKVVNLVQEQVGLLKQICAEEGAVLHHVKPHGALYNQSAKDPEMAQAIAATVAAIDPQLMLYGLSGSVSLQAAQAAGLRAVAEVFADRTYQEDGALTPRASPHAVITDAHLAMAQAVQMVCEGTVTTVTGKNISLQAQTICLHGDGAHALSFAQALQERLQVAHIKTEAP